MNFRIKILFVLFIFIFSISYYVINSFFKVRRSYTRAQSANRAIQLGESLKAFYLSNGSFAAPLVLELEELGLFRDYNGYTFSILFNDENDGFTIIYPAAEQQGNETSSGRIVVKWDKSKNALDIESDIKKP